MRRDAQLRTVALDEAMDLAAPLGSAPWARAVHVHMQTMLEDATTQLQRFRRCIRLFDTERGYQHLDDEYGHPFPSLRAFCTTKPPYGLGYDPILLEAMVVETREMTLGEKIKEIKALQEHGGDRRGEGFQVDNVNLKAGQGGNSRDYLLARMKRDHPEIAESLARGEYPSVRAAAKAAGLVHDPTPLDYLHRYWRDVDPADRLRFLVEMLTPNERRALQCGFEEDEA